MNEQISKLNIGDDVNNSSLLDNIELIGAWPSEIQDILSLDALKFMADIERAFRPRRLAILKNRDEKSQLIRKGRMPSFCPDTDDIRKADWKINMVPSDLQDRRVEITGPVDRKLIINALNSGANVFMADFEDSCSPTWNNIINGQINLKDAINGTINYSSEFKKYTLNNNTATLMVRPRGWHMLEKHVLVDGLPVSASIFDFAIFLFNNHRKLIKSGSGPYFYLPKLEGFLEARLWNDIFIMAQSDLGIMRGTIKACVLIETILAAFEMDEILFELREHSAGLNCGRWDYIFSVIKKFNMFSEFVLPDRNSITMDKHFLKSYVDLLIKICHKRGAHAIGGMAAQIPSKAEGVNSPEMEKVKIDKSREAAAGHDGTWVAHPGLIEIAASAFIHKNQLKNLRDDVQVTGNDLLMVPQGKITIEGLRTNIEVAIIYINSWLNGKGCVPINNLMEDAATAEIARAQIWQWIKHSSVLDDGRKVSDVFKDELEFYKLNSSEPMHQAAKLFKDMVLAKEFPDFLTLKAYEYL